MPDKNIVKTISGFWRRIGAFFIDSVFLGIIGFLLGLVFKEQFVEIGGWGRLLGFAIALTYFGVMNSKITRGQTIGKKVLKIRVVNNNNQPIDILRSFIRYSILGTPFFLSGTHFTNEMMPSLWIYPLSFVIFGGIFSIIYLYIFNRVTRQSLHDLAVGTFVVNSNNDNQEVGEAIWRPHLLIVSGFFLIATIVPTFTSTLTQDEPFKGLLETQAALTKYPSVNYATVFDGTTTYSSIKKGTSTTTHINSQIFLKENSIDDVGLARNLAEIIVTNYPESLSKNTIQIELTYGYDIGIASFWNKHTHNFDPSEFKTNDIASIQDIFRKECLLCEISEYSK